MAAVIFPPSNLDANQVLQHVYDEVTQGLRVSAGFEKFFNLIINSKWMELAVYDEVIPSFSLDGITSTLTFKEDGAIIGQAIFTYNSDTDWAINLKRFITDDDNNILLDDDNSPLNLD